MKRKRHHSCNNTHLFVGGSILIFIMPTICFIYLTYSTENISDTIELNLNTIDNDHLEASPVTDIYKTDSIIDPLVKNEDVQGIYKQEYSNLLPKFLIDERTNDLISQFKYIESKHINSSNINSYRTVTSVYDTQHRTLIDFNYELLCPLSMHISQHDNQNKKHDRSTHAKSNPITDTNVNRNANANTNDRDANKIENRMNFLNHLFKIQFPDKCDLTNNKFYIFNSPCHESGLFATLRCWVFYLSHALSEQRTFIMLNGYKMFEDEKICTDKKQECFFLPMTNCTINNITKLIEQSKEKNEYCLDYEPRRYKYTMSSIPDNNDDDDKTMTKGLGPKSKQQLKQENHIKQLIIDRDVQKCDNPIFDIGDKKQADYQALDGKFHSIDDKYVIKEMKYIGWFPLLCNNGMPGGKQSLENKAFWYNKFNLTCSEYTTILYSFLLRIQPQLQSLIYNIIYNSLINTKNLSFYRPENTVSVVIRYSDKCRNVNNAYNKAEMDCFKLTEYVSIVKQLKLLKNDLIQHMIVTSESPQIMTNITNNSLFDFNKFGFDLIYNKYDVMQNTGHRAKSTKEKKLLKNTNVMQIMISMLSSIKLQFGGRYMFEIKASNWVKNICLMAHKLYCLPIYIQQIKSLINNGYYYFDDEDDDDNDNQVSVSKINHILSPLVKPLRLTLDESEYDWNKNRHCVELVAPAFRTRSNSFHRYVRYDEKLSTEMKDKFDNTTLWQKFGISNHLDEYCLV